VATMDEDERERFKRVLKRKDWVFKEESCANVSVSFSRYYSVVIFDRSNEIVLHLVSSDYRFVPVLIGEVYFGQLVLILNLSDRSGQHFTHLNCSW